MNITCVEISYQSIIANCTKVYCYKIKCNKIVIVIARCRLFFSIAILVQRTKKKTTTWPKRNYEISRKLLGFV